MTITGITLREASPADAESLVRLRRIYWDQTFRALGGGGNADRYMRFERADNWAAMLEDGPGVIAEGDVVVGAGLLIPCYGEPVAGVAPVDATELETLIYVSETHQRAGIGGQLATWLEQRAVTAGASSIWVDVHDSFAAFFERRGYRREPGEGEVGGVRMSVYRRAL